MGVSSKVRRQVSLSMNKLTQIIVPDAGNTEKA